MEMNFCRRCGQALKEVSSDAYGCVGGHTLYLSPAPSSGIFFIDSAGQVVLSRRGIEPGKGMLDTIGGFINPGESAEVAVVREIEEETGLTPDRYGSLEFLCTATMNYRYQNEDRPVLSTFFWTRLDGAAKPQPRDDVAEIVYLPLSEVNPNEFHANDIRAGFEALKSKLEV